MRARELRQAPHSLQTREYSYGGRRRCLNALTFIAEEQKKQKNDVRLVEVWRVRLNVADARLDERMIVARALNPTR